MKSSNVLGFLMKENGVLNRSNTFVCLPISLNTFARVQREMSWVTVNGPTVGRMIARSN